MKPVWLMVVLVLAVVACVVSGWGTRLCIRSAARWGLLDRPDHRKDHEQATPATGGIAFVGTFLVLCVLGVLAGLALGVWFPRPEPGGVLGYAGNVIRRLPQFGWLLATTAGLLALGVWDDKRPQRAVVKLIGQLILVIPAVWLGGLRFTAFLPAYLAIPLSVLWFVTLINALNFMDNMDGLAGGIGVIAAGCLVVVGLLQGQIFVPAMGAVLGGSLLGFLACNAAPARIFMGDGGALPLGFLLAALCVLTTYYSPASGAQGAMPAAVLTPLLILAVPLYDVGTTLWKRRCEHRPLMQADHSHFSHRLVDLGFTPRRAVMVIWLLTGSTGLAAVMLQRMAFPWSWLAFVQVGLVLGLVRLLEMRAERGPGA